MNHRANITEGEKSRLSRELGEIETRETREREK